MKKEHSVKTWDEELFYREKGGTGINLGEERKTEKRRSTFLNKGPSRTEN